MADLSTALAKLERANEHARQLDACLSDWTQTGYEVKHDFYEDSGWNDLRLALKFDPPNMRLALIGGDVMTNARGVLDYLVWQLVLLSGNEPGKHTAFPVVKDAAKWPSAVASQLKGVEACWVGVIDELQPYHNTEPDRQLLSALDDLNNLNKHQTLPAAIHRTHKLTIGDLRVTPGMSYDFDWRDPPLVDNAVLLRIRSADKARMQFRPIDLTWRVGFDDGTDRQWDNKELLEWLDMVIKRFGPAFESGT